jgi:hypothetical protein
VQGALALTREFELELRVVLESGRRTHLALVRGTRAPLTSSFEPRLRPLMVTTLGRTGSMALMRMLEAHPEVLVYRPYRYEQQVAGYWLDLLLTLAEPASYIRQIAPVGNLEDPLWWLGAGAPPPRLRDTGLERWLGSEAIEQLADIAQERIAAVYDQIAAGAGKPGAAFFAEKHSLRTAALAAELYPAGRELFLVRDFRDMVASIMSFNRRRGVEGFGRAAAASDEEWAAGLSGWAAALLAAWRRRSQTGHLVRYEDLVTDPEPTLEALLRYTGVDSSPQAVAQMRSALATEMPELAEHRTSGGPAESIGRWRSDLPPAVAATCERVFGDALAEFGYAGG